MATESTAIVNLVDLVKNNKPLPRDAGDDLLFGGGARFDPMAMDVPAASFAPLPTQPARTASGTKPPPIASSQRSPSVVLPGPFVREPAHAIERTIRVPRSTVDPQVKKFALPVGLFVVAMILLSIYLAKGDKKAPKAAVVPGPAPALKMPVLTPPPAPAPAPVAPPVVAAKTEPVVTPIASPTVEPIDPPAAAQPTVPTVPTVPDPDVAAADDAPPAAPVASPAKASKHRDHHHHAAAKRAKTETRVAVADAPKPAKVEKLGGKGALVLSSSPSREIWIDGRKTKQMTPQRLTLAPGTHNVTLFDKKTRSAKTFQVEITANQTLKVAKS